MIATLIFAIGLMGGAIGFAKLGARPLEPLGDRVLCNTLAAFMAVGSVLMVIASVTT